MQHDTLNHYVKVSNVYDTQRTKMPEVLVNRRQVSLVQQNFVLLKKKRSNYTQGSLGIAPKGFWIIHHTFLESNT